VKGKITLPVVSLNNPLFWKNSCPMVRCLVSQWRAQHRKPCQHVHYKYLYTLSTWH